MAGLSLWILSVGGEGFVVLWGLCMLVSCVGCLDCHWVAVAVIMIRQIQPKTVCLCGKGCSISIACVCRSVKNGTGVIAGRR